MHLDNTMYDVLRILAVAGVACVLWGIYKAKGGGVMAQEQLWICPKNAECERGCLHKEPHRKNWNCDNTDAGCTKCIPYAQEQGGEDRLPMPPTDIIEASEKVADWYSMQCRGGWQLGKVESRDYSRKDLNDLRARLEQAQVQLAGCGVAALGGPEIEKYSYGWSQSYQDVIDLRARLDSVEKENAELRDWNKFAMESVAVASAEVSKLQAKNAELRRQKEAWRDEFIILNDVMRDVSACNAYDDDEISRIDKSEVNL